MDLTESRGKRRTRDGLIDWAVFAVLLAVVSAVTLTLFYRQTTGDPSSYHSDMKAYILEMQGLDSGYSFPYPVFFKLSALIHLFASPEMAVAIATMLLNSLAILVTKLAFNRLLLPHLWGRRHAGGQKGEAGGLAGAGWPAGVVVSLAVVSLFFISMLYPPKGIYLPGIKFNYLGVFTANPFHNATYMAARPFAILAFLWYVKLLAVYEKGVAGHKGGTAQGAVLEAGDAAQGRDYALFALFLLLATMTKPSFTLVLVSTAGLVMLYRLFRSGFRNFVPTVQLGLCFIPTFLDLLYQYRGVFVRQDGGEGGVGFGFGDVWSLYCGNIPLAVCLAAGFPLLALALNRKECRKNTLFAFSLQMYLVSFAEAFFLYEKGFRKADFNFSWGYMYGIFFFHFSALLLLLDVTARRLGGGPKPASGPKPAGGSKPVTRPKPIDRLGDMLLVLQWLAYLGHVVCGIFYFGTFMSGAMYY